jgi:hypothetical protein
VTVEEIHKRQRQDDAENAIERAGVRDCVQMRTDQKGRRGRRGRRVWRGWIDGPEVPGGIDSYAHAQPIHPSGEARVDLAHRRRKKPSRRHSRLLRALSQPTAIANDLAGPDEHHEPRYVL